MECIQTPDLWTHMMNFQAIADANLSPADGHASRVSGETGYKASADYVAKVMTDAGYNVTVQTYLFTYFAFKAPPVMAEVSPQPKTYVLNQDYGPGQTTGETTGKALQAAGGIVIYPPGANQASSSSSGCTAADFTDFVAGRVALIQRGSCPYGVKYLNAKAAGASGVIIFNEGNSPNRVALEGGSLVDANLQPIDQSQLTIPLVFTSYAVGADLYSQYQVAGPNVAALPVLNISIHATIHQNTPDYNVIADSKGGNKKPCSGR